MPLTGSNALGWINVAAAPVLVGTYAGTRELGLLQLAYTMVLYPQILTTIVARVALPVYARLTDRGLLLRTVDESTSAGLKYLAALTLAIAASGPLWVPVLYGPEWVGMVPIMFSVAPALGLSMSLASVIAALNATGRVGQTLLVTLLFSVLYWAVGATLVPHFGAIGLALSQSLATVAYAAFLFLYRRAIGPLSVRGALVYYTILCAIACVSAAWSATGAGTIAEVTGAAAICALVLYGVDLRTVRGWLGVAAESSPR